jgi:hypothetical protein
MTKLNLSLGILLIGTALAAGNFVACSSSGGGNNSPGTAGSSSSGTAGATGTAGSNGGSSGTAGGGGSTGTAGTGAMCTMNAATKPDCSCVGGAYKHNMVCACQDGIPDVCPTVGCTSKMTDADNCGMCGMKCGATSTCNMGACGPAPTVALVAVAGCMDMTIAVNAGTVYYTDAAHNTVNKVGGTAPLAMNEMGATWLAMHGTDLYWYNKGTKTVRKLAGATGTPANVYMSTTADVGGFLVSADGMSVYISVGTDVIKVSATTVGGGTPVTVASEKHNGIPQFLALNGTSNIVYPTALNGDVDSADLGATAASCGVEDANQVVDMTTCARLARSQGELFPAFVAVVGPKAYWVDGVNVKAEAIPAAGAMGTTFETISMAQNSISAATATTDTIFFAEDGIVEKAPAASNPNNNPPILLARGQMAPQSIAVDTANNKVYWATKDCAIASTASK